MDLNTSYVTGLLRGLSTPTRKRPLTLMVGCGYGMPRSGMDFKTCSGYVKLRHGAVWHGLSICSKSGYYIFSRGGVRCSVVGHGVESNFIGGIL